MPETRTDRIVLTVTTDDQAPPSDRFARDLAKHVSGILRAAGLGGVAVSAAVRPGPRSTTMGDHAGE